MKQLKWLTSDWGRTIRLGMWLVSGASAAVACLSGCIWHPQNPAATQPSTEIDLATTQPSYWLKRPAAAVISYPRFQPLWDACESTARSYTFPLERQDYRSGVLTTSPVVSKQFLEPWRKDAQTIHDVVQSSLVTIRRSIRFEIEHGDGDSFVMTPKVLVERETIVERRLTSVAQYRYSFSGPAAIAKDAVQTEAIDLPAKYWTPIARDTQMELDIAADVKRRLKEERVSGNRVQGSVEKSASGG